MKGENIPCKHLERPKFRLFEREDPCAKIDHLSQCLTNLIHKILSQPVYETATYRVSTF